MANRAYARPGRHGPDLPERSPISHDNFHFAVSDDGNRAIEIAAHSRRIGVGIGASRN
ncbi:MAG: hypothetical protein QOH24_1321 [Verrucomicrobiota bacterium]|jgi:hypothetical protein